MMTKEYTKIWSVVSGVAVLGVVLGAYFLVRAPHGKPPAGIAEAKERTVTIPIEGMTCASCVARIKQTLKSIDGVAEVEVSLEHRDARVRYIEEKVSPQRHMAAINDLGYKARTSTPEKAK